jgi:dihydroorotate dehydrogenase electron transfer subunit
VKKTVQNLTVKANIKLNRDHHLLKLESPVKLEEIIPGQFANILVDKSHNTFLRRPFSIHDIDYDENTLDFIIKGIGEGSLTLSSAAVGDELSVIFPLGNGFSLPEKDDKVLLVGGGCGIAPLMILAQYLKDITNDIFILLGARSAEDLVELDKYSSVGTLLTTTEDGTAGEKGFVTNHSVFKEGFSSFNKVYTCGPEPMMKSVAQKASEHKISCEVSLENTMACGFGVCLCCVTDTIEGHKCVCTDGPVFNIKSLKWLT